MTDKILADNFSWGVVMVDDIAITFDHTFPTILALRSCWKWLCLFYCGIGDDFKFCNVFFLLHHWTKLMNQSSRYLYQAECSAYLQVQKQHSNTLFKFCTETFFLLKHEIRKDVFCVPHCKVLKKTNEVIPFICSHHMSFSMWRNLITFKFSRDWLLFR